MCVFYVGEPVSEFSMPVASSTLLGSSEGGGEPVEGDGLAA